MDNNEDWLCAISCGQLQDYFWSDFAVSPLFVLSETIDLITFVKIS